jgi:hypothetical protein
VTGATPTVQPSMCNPPILPNNIAVGSVPPAQLSTLAASKQNGKPEISAVEFHKSDSDLATSQPSTHKFCSAWNSARAVAFKRPGHEPPARDQAIRDLQYRPFLKHEIVHQTYDKALVGVSLGKPAPMTPSVEASGSTRAAEPRKLAIEICCGCARLTREFCNQGLDGTGIDYTRNKSKPVGPAVVLDLTTEHGQLIMESTLNSGRVAVVTAAPPCGTASRAREIPISAERRRRGVPQPKPLRSETYPEGLPGLTGLDAERVATANKLYAWIAGFLVRANALGVLIIVENPRNSLMWQTRYFKTLAQAPGILAVIFQACMHGGKRDKITKMLCNFAALTRIGIMCDSSHKHEPWDSKWDPRQKRYIFDTEKEAEYPVELCKAIASAVADELALRGKPLSPNAAHDDQARLQQADHLAKTVAWKQARGLRAPALVPEFAYIHRVRISDVDLSKLVPGWRTHHRLTTSEARLLSNGNHLRPLLPLVLPVGAKLLDSRPEVPSDSQGGDCDGHEWLDLDGAVSSDLQMFVKFGVFRNPEEFIAQAKLLTHPFDQNYALDADSLKAAFDILTKGKLEIMRHRLGQLKKYSELAENLKLDEAELKKTMEPEVRKVVGQKRILLFEQMLKDAGYQDDELIADLRNGFPLTGTLNYCPEFPPMLRPASIDKQELLSTAKWALHSLEGKARNRSRACSDDEALIAEAIANITAEEIDDNKCWARGPYTAQQLDDKYGKDAWVPSRRFGIRQGDKVRAVDDFSEFLVNAACSPTFKINLGGVDELLGITKAMLSAVAENRAVSFNMPDGSTLNGTLHPSWTLDEARDIMGRCLDLKDAYKQLARNPVDARFSIIAVLDEASGTYQFYEAIALPFGASASVFAFNRAARALRKIMSRLFSLVLTNFFDDFPQLELRQLQRSALLTAEGVLKMLGWSVSQKAGKRLDFSEEFTALGVVVDLQHAKRGKIIVKNKPSRVESLRMQVKNIIACNALSPVEAASLKGKFVYASAQCFGRVGIIAVQALGQREKRGGGSTKLSEGLSDILNWMITYLQNSAPREIRITDKVPPVLIFTDGACEGDQYDIVTAGAIIFDPLTQFPEMVGFHVPSGFVKSWKSTGLSQVIGQAEIFPVLVAKLTWANKIANRKIIVFVDNDSAKEALVRGYSPSIASFNLIISNAELDVDSRCLAWYTRVPTKSNPADDPSRLEFEQPRKLFGAKLVDPVFPPNRMEDKGPSF